jgi:hypothetical protein
MSGELERQLREDRALLQADVAHLRANLAGKSIPSRIVERIGDGAAEVFDEAVEVAESHKGALATLLAAVVLWFARHPILSLFTDEDGTERDDEADR